MNKTNTLLLWLAIFGGLAVAIEVLKVIFRFVPRLLTVQSKIWGLLADTLAIPVIRRRAIATRVEEVLNQAAFTLQPNLPQGWIKRAKIRWVRHSGVSQFRDGDIVLRVRPEKNPDHNLMQSLYTYFYSALFPDSKDILPDAIVSSVALAITRASLEGNHQYLLKEFDEVFLPAIGKSKQGILEDFGDCVRLNEYGFLMGPFLREVDHVAKESRFSFKRDRIPAMIHEILTHMLAFQPVVRNNLPDDNWFYEGPCTSYGLILVSKPPDIRPGIAAYVKRGQSRIQRGIKRLYVIGRHEERDFVSSVINALLRIRELKGIEFFHLFRDYRGARDGFGALLGLDEMLAKLNLTQRPSDGVQVQPSVTSVDHELEQADESQGLRRVGQLDLAKIVEDIIVQLSDYEGEWISLAQFGGELRKQVPEFTPQRYGGRNLISVLRELHSIELEERGAGSFYVRLRTGNHKTTEHVPSHKATENVPSAIETETYKRIVEVVRDNAYVGSWLFLGQLGYLLKQQMPNFDCHQFEASSLSQFLHRIPELEFEERGDWPNKSIYVRIKQ
jgi:hypothetical protein